jgi:hypothetical protein
MTMMVLCTLYIWNWSQQSTENTKLPKAKHMQACSNHISVCLFALRS